MEKCEYRVLKMVEIGHLKALRNALDEGNLTRYLLDDRIPIVKINMLDSKRFKIPPLYKGGNKGS